MKTRILNSTNFDSTVSAESRPVLVDFWADWCGPCKMIAPVLEEVATEQHDRAVVAKVNIDEAPDLAARYGITAIPTLMVFRNGAPVLTLRGIQSKAALNASLS